MNDVSPITYEAISETLIALKSNADPAQIHGICCGFLCASPKGNATEWLNKVIGKSKKGQSRAILKALYDYTADQLIHFSFDFALLLPNDDIDINNRAEALGLWCQGFLSGLTQSGIPIENRQPSDLTETLNDIIEIAKVNYGDIIENEEDEVAYVELVEYVRMAVLMVFQELNANNPMLETTH